MSRVGQYLQARRWRRHQKRRHSQKQNGNGSDTLVGSKKRGSIKDITRSGTLEGGRSKTHAGSRMSFSEQFIIDYEAQMACEDKGTEERRSLYVCNSPEIFESRITPYTLDKEKKKVQGSGRDQMQQSSLNQSTLFSAEVVLTEKAALDEKWCVVSGRQPDDCLLK